MPSGLGEIGRIRMKVEPHRWRARPRITSPNSNQLINYSFVSKEASNLQKPMVRADFSDFAARGLPESLDHMAKLKVDLVM